MKLAFSTLGCPDWSWREIFATAKDLGMNGIEIRGIGSQMFAPKANAFLPENIDATLAELKRVGLEIPMLTSNADLSVKGGEEQNIREAKDYIELAKKTGTEYVRVMCQNSAAPRESIDLDRVAELYAELCDYAAGTGVFPLIETNSYLADSEQMLKFIRKVNRSNAFVLWDIHHPFRFFRESPAKTAGNLQGLVKYVHVKDSAMEDSGLVYRMMGYGDVPIFDMLALLHSQGYEGYISLEWVKRWCPELQEPGIVFSHYANYMQYLLRQI